MNSISRLVSTPGARAITNSIIRGYAKELKFGAEGRKAMLVGIDILADAVATTMGPKVGLSSSLMGDNK